jgi:hypothetical protein
MQKGPLELLEEVIPTSRVLPVLTPAQPRTRLWSMDHQCQMTCRQSSHSGSQHREREPRALANTI